MRLAAAPDPRLRCEALRHLARDPATRRALIAALPALHPEQRCLAQLAALWPEGSALRHDPTIVEQLLHSGLAALLMVADPPGGLDPRRVRDLEGAGDLADNDPEALEPDRVLVADAGARREGFVALSSGGRRMANETRVRCTAWPGQIRRPAVCRGIGPAKRTRRLTPQRSPPNPHLRPTSVSIRGALWPTPWPLPHDSGGWP